ncbi:DNA polymerase [Pseudonocardia sichuanensis]
MTSSAMLTAQQLADLDVARALAAAGIPIFVAYSDTTEKIGYKLPSKWQQTTADPAIVDLWQPGMALCAVMGHGLDLLDVDPHNGGDLATLNGSRPAHYAVAATPSGGQHYFIRSTGSGSRDNTWPGIDVKSGLADGSGRGFAFLAPTVRASKVTGEPAAYGWVQVPDLARLAAQGPQDTTGAALAARIRELRATSNSVRNVGGPAWWQEFVSAREPQSVPAADRAIAEKLREVAEWVTTSGVGFRTVLLRAALTLGGYVGGGYLDEQDARRGLEEAAGAVWGTPDDDDLLWIQQGLDDGVTQPFQVFTAEDERMHSEAAQAVAHEGEDPPPADDAPPPVDPPWNVFTVLDPGQPFDPVLDSTDQGLAKAVAYRMYPALRYAKDASVWVKRERDVWEECGDDMSDWIVSMMAELMPLGSTPVPKDVGERTDQHWQAVRRAIFMSSAGTGKIGRKLRAIVRSDHPAALRISDLDSNPEVLWAGAVPWDLRASGDVPTPAHWVDPNTPHLRTAMCAPDPTVATPRWDAFLAAVLPDPEVRAWAMRVLAIALTGYPDAAVPVLYGRERSGKTSLIEMLVTVLGSYGHPANPKLLSAQDNGHDVIVYELKGRRLAFIDEGPKRGHEATERLKQLTGGGSLTARAMRANPVSFRPTHTLVMTTNNEPHLTDPALRARMRLIPCDQPEELVRPSRLPLLGQGLLREAPGILAAMMREAAAYLADRDSAAIAAAPLSIRGLADEMAAGQDPVREWVENCTVAADPGTPGRELRNLFARWHQDHPLYRRMSVPSETAFGRTLSEMGFPPHKVGGRWYRSLSVLQGPSGPGAPLPTPAQFMAGSTGPGGFVAGSGGLVAGSGGSAAEPARPSNPTSSAVSPRTSGGLAGYSSIPEQNNTETTTERYTGVKAPEPATFHEGVSTQGVTSNDGRGGLPKPNPPEPATSVRRGPTPSEVAARAYGGKTEKQISKAEARAQLKEEQRQDAIRSASGEVLGLPAVVDRDGHVLPLDLDQAAAVVRTALGRSGALTVDVETSGYPVGHEHYELRSVQLGDAVAAVVLHPVEHAELIRALLEEAPRLHAHSATADLVPLAHAGLIDMEDGWERMHDTVIPAKLADPQSTGSDPGLKALAGAVLGGASVAPAADEARDALFKAGKWLKSTKADTPVARSGWAQVQTGSTTMLRYAASDVLDTGALATVLPQPTPAVLVRERLAQRMTARVAHHGVRIDAEHVRALTETHTAARAEVAERARAFGVENPGSDQQVAAVALQLGATLPTTKTGRPSVAAGVLEPLRGADGALGAFVNEVLDYRHHDTVLGLFLEPYRLLCERGDGRARPTIYTLGTDTGRMSATRPNIQQLSREGGVRAILTADPGQLMIGADFSGVEIRVAAALSQDATLLKMLADGRDLHAEVARQVWGPEATKAHRYTAKRIVFGRLYGGGIPTLAAQAGVSHTVAEAAVATLDALTPQLAAWSASVREAVKRGQTQFASYSGRVIHLPRDYPHKAPNYCIQGTARELLIDALVRWRETRWGSAVLLPVHDELDVFVPEADADEATAELVRCMETELLGVRIVADPSTPAFAWADSA